MDTSRIEEVKAPLHDGTPSSTSLQAISVVSLSIMARRCLSSLGDIEQRLELCVVLLLHRSKWRGGIDSEDVVEKEQAKK